MKKLVVFVLFTVSAIASKAQTFDEWFKQKKTQKKYLIQQIAALQMYVGYVQKGYSIAEKGLNNIGNIKKDDFNLHSDFFGSLQSVNPAISSYSKVADIIAFQVKFVHTYKSTYKYVQLNSLYTPAEVHFIHKVFTNLINGSTEDVNQIITVIAANELEMKDDERLERIDALYNSIQDKYAFAQSFGDEAKVLALRRTKEKNNIETGRRFYGIKN